MYRSSLSHTAILRVCLVGLTAAAVMAGMMAVALAQAPEAPASSFVDVGPIVERLIGWGSEMVYGLLALVAFPRLWKLLGLKMDEATRGAVEQILRRAVDFARDELRDRALGGIPIDLKHEAIARAAEYAMENGPATMARIGVTSVVSAKLENMIAGRMSDYLIDPEKEVWELTPGQPDQVAGTPLSKG